MHIYIYFAESVTLELLEAIGEYAIGTEISVREGTLAAKLEIEDFEQDSPEFLEWLNEITDSINEYGDCPQHRMAVVRTERAGS